MKHPKHQIYRDIYFLEVSKEIVLFQIHKEAVMQAEARIHPRTETWWFVCSSKCCAQLNWSHYFHFEEDKHCENSESQIYYRDTLKLWNLKLCFILQLPYPREVILFGCYTGYECCHWERFHSDQYCKCPICQVPTFKTSKRQNHSKPHRYVLLCFFMSAYSVQQMIYFT